ncbi:MAG: glycerophosphodiester phosphodiesterase [Gammaproteobacteria bacterium]
MPSKLRNGNPGTAGRPKTTRHAGARARLVAGALLLGGQFMPLEALELQGHRGARGLAPENTLAGFATALRIGVHTLELDVGMTADGIVVVSHDPRLNPNITRDPGGQWLTGPGPVIHRNAYAEIARYDVGGLKPGTRYASRYPDQRPTPGESIPTLKSVIENADATTGGTVRYNIEIKIDPEEPELTADAAALVDAVIAVLREMGAAGRAVVQSFDWSVVQRVHEVAPDLTTACLSAQQDWMDTIEADAPGATAWTAGIASDVHDGSVPDMVHATGAAIWSPYHGDLDAAKLARAHQLGLRVVVWTVNDPDKMRSLIEMGVDAIISDFPDRLREVAARKGLPLPAAAP